MPDMKKHLKIGIAGCGIGGLTTGALLAQAGHTVTLFDQFDSPAHVGSGLMIQPVGLAVLHAVGAGDAVLAKGMKITEMRGHEARTGRNVLSTGYGKRFGLAISRPSLSDALYKVALQSGCIVEHSSTVTATSLSADKRMIILENGVQHGPFDLVVDASGVSSRLSKMKRTPLPYGALWGNVDWPNTDLPTTHLTQCYRRASKMAGILPIGSFPNETTSKTAVFWSLHRNGYENWRATPLDDWKAEAANLWPAFAPFLEQITSHDDLTMAQYNHGTLAKPFEDRLVFIGDAAHCTSPQLGQGANMALLDAYALAEMLREHTVQDALPAYAKSRRTHILTYQILSRIFTPMYQSDSRILPVIRDWVLAPLMLTPPAPWVARKLVCGDVIPPIKGLRIPLPHSFARSD